MGFFALGSLILVVGIFVSAFFLWVGAKVTGVDVEFIQLLVIAVIASVLGLIPMIGGILGIIVMFVLVCKWADIPFFPDALLMVVVARLASFLTALAIGAALA